MEKLQFAKYIKTVSFWKVLKDEDLSTYIKDYNDVVVKYYDEKKINWLKNLFHFWCKQRRFIQQESMVYNDKEGKQFLAKWSKQFQQTCLYFKHEKGQNLIDMDLYSPKMDDFTAKLFVNSNYHRHFIEKNIQEISMKEEKGTLSMECPKTLLKVFWWIENLKKMPKSLTIWKIYFLMLIFATWMERL